MGFLDGGDTKSESTNQNTQQTVTPQVTGADYGTTINLSPFSGLNFNKGLSAKNTGASARGVKVPSGSAPNTAGGSFDVDGNPASVTSNGITDVSGFDAGFELNLDVDSLVPQAAELFEGALAGFRTLVDHGQSAFDESLAFLTTQGDGNRALVRDLFTDARGLATDATDAFTRGGSLGAAAGGGTPVIIPPGIDFAKLALYAGLGLGAYYLLRGIK